MGIIINRLKEVISLLKKQRDLEEKFNEKYKDTEKIRKTKVENVTKTIIKNTIYAPKSEKAFERILDCNFINAYIPLPETSELDIYQKLIDIIGKRINEEGTDILYNKDTFNVNIFSLLNKVSNIISSTDKDIIDKLLYILRYAENKDKLKCALDLLKNSNLQEQIFFKKLVIFLSGTEDEEKLRILRVLIERLNITGAPILLNYINLIIDILDNDELDEYVKINILNLNNILFEKNRFGLIQKNNYSFVDEVVMIVKDLKDRNKLEYLYKLLKSETFLKLNSSVKQKRILNRYLEVIDDDLEKNEIKLLVIENILCKDIEIELFELILRKLGEIKSIKAFKVLLYVFSLMEEFSKTESKLEIIDILEKDEIVVKKLTINLDKEDD